MKLQLFDTKPLEHDSRKQQIVTIMVMVVNRLDKSEIMSFETDMLFCNEKARHNPDLYIYDHTSICYWTKNNALHYLTNTNIPHHDRHEIMKQFREKNQGVDYYFDAVVLSTQDYQK